MQWPGIHLNKAAPIVRSARYSKGRACALINHHDWRAEVGRVYIVMTSMSEMSACSYSCNVGRGRVAARHEAAVEALLASILKICTF